MSAFKKLKALEEALKDEGPGLPDDLVTLLVVLPEIRVLVEAAEQATEFLDWAVDKLIPEHEAAITSEVREQTGRTDIVAAFDSPLPALRAQLRAALTALAEALGEQV